jgi:hypothetical protein
MISKLSQDKTDKFPFYRDKWLRIGLCTDPIDFDRAKNAVNLAYECAGLKPPSDHIYAKSPFEARAMIKKHSRDVKGSEVFGCHDASWLSLYDFFLQEFSLESCEKLLGMMEVAKECGWCNMFSNIVVIQDRPKAIHFDDRRLLHKENGPSIEYLDGFSVYSWHGTRIPGKWIEEGISAAEALKVQNMEQRRSACEIVGWDSILQQLKAKTLDKHPDPQIGELLSVEIPDVGTEKFLRVQCGTGRFFSIPVDHSVTTALEANSWTYAINPEDYKPEIRT